MVRLRIMITQDEFSIDPLIISPNLCYEICMGSSKENLCFDFGVYTWSIHVHVLNGANFCQGGGIDLFIYLFIYL